VALRCVACGGDMDPVLAPATTHPMCLPVFAELDDTDPFSRMLKQKLIEIILWADKQNPRSRQVAIGPSEIGDQCDRRIGYRIAQAEPCNTDFDPWAAIVGTALHSWLDQAVQLWMSEHGTKDWATETTLSMSEFVEGHSDLYSHEFQAVIDWKGAGPDVMRKLRRDGPSAGYMIQTHIYGYGFEQRGWPVKKVALAFLPRAGWLKDMYVWSADYDPKIAMAALDRLYRIARTLVDLDVLNQSHRWQQVDAVPSNACGFCPWYDPGRDAERGADGTGCPGR
jgi:hypothetical protein